MLGAMSSSELHDYEVMFKKHVHDNLMLNNDLRLMDGMKKAKLKELSRDRDLFKAKFSKFNKVNFNRNIPERHYIRNATPKASHKPSFIVCKNSPCSLKTWNNLTDLTKEKVDVYKTEVLQTEEAAVSFLSNENNHSNNSEETERSNSEINTPRRKISSALLPDKVPVGLQLSRCQTTLSKSSDLGDQKTDPDDFLLPDFRQRSSTMPSYHFKTKLNLGNNRPSPVSRNEQQCEVSESKHLEINPRHQNCANINMAENESEKTKSLPCVTVSDHSNENDTKVLNVTFDLPDDKIVQEDIGRRTALPKIDKRFQRAKSMIISDNQLSPDLSQAFRRRSMTVASILRPDNKDDRISSAETFRRRSMTIDSTSSTNLGKLLNRRVSIDKFNMAARRQSLFDKLVTASMPSCEDISDLEWCKSLEDLEACRYLRKPGENIQGSREDLTLDNVIFKHDSE